MKDDGEEKKGAALLLEKYVERSPSERGKIVGAVLLTSLLIAWGSFVDPGSAALKKAGEVQKRVAAHEDLADLDLTALASGGEGFRHAGHPEVHSWHTLSLRRGPGVGLKAPSAIVTACSRATPGGTPAEAACARTTTHRPPLPIASTGGLFVSATRRPARH